MNPIWPLATAMLLQSLPAPGGAQWEEVASDPGGRYFLDPASVRRDGDRAHFLIRANAAQVEPDGTDHAVVRYRADCRRRTLAIEATDFYRGDGSYVRGYENAPDEIRLEPAVESAGEAQFLRRVCGG